MTKLKSGYYSYLNKKIAFVGMLISVSELNRDAALVSPSVFHQIAIEQNIHECAAITYFNFCDELLHGIHFAYDIEGLEDV